MRYLLAAFLGVLITVVVGAFLLKDKISFQVVQKTPDASSSALPQGGSPSPSLIASPTPTPSRIVSGGGILSFPKFEMVVPGDWVEKRESPNSDMERLTLSKEGYSISILEGGFGGAVCLFPGDADVEGPSSRYTTFVDITTKSGNLFRRVSSTGSGFGVCEKTQYGWGQPTSYGAMSISVPTPTDPLTIKVIDGILSSIAKK